MDYRTTRRLVKLPRARFPFYRFCLGLVCVGSLALPLVACASEVEEITSLYTELSAPPCEALPETENGGGGLKCEGPVGFQILAHDEDSRVSISVVDHLGEVHPLEFWDVVTRGFSAFGPRVEWRLQGGRPMALIVRVEAYEDPERPDRTVSYLVVAKVADRKMCVTDRIPPSNNQNLIAREAADSSTDRPCLQFSE